MRIENIADVFDSNGQVSYQEINVRGIANQLFEIANDNKAFNVNIKIEETSLTANQSYKDMSERRLKWKTFDDQAKSLGESQDEKEDFNKMKFQ